VSEKIRGGIFVFFQSYAILTQYLSQWDSQLITQRIGKAGKLVYSEGKS
jgi:Rad3-related DNA helicase